MTADQPGEPRLILASSSPRRRALLSEAGVEFQVIDPPLAEPNDGHAKLSPTRQAEALAYFKARSVADSHPDALVLGADTVVASEAEVIGKPSDANHAREMLATLSGTTHQVITGVAILGPGRHRLIASATTRVTMRTMTEAEIDAYIDSGEWIGKAGAYAIQETADQYIEAVDGSFTNVVGLPVQLVMDMLHRLGQDPRAIRGS